MLKTLEEPPEYLKFVLATTDPQKVPVTVLSRCLQFNLRPMAPETVQEHLARVLQAEGVPAQAPALRLLSRAARGSMRDALSLTDQAIAFGSGQIEEAAVRQMLGSADRSHVLRLVEALANADGASVVQTCEALRHHGLSAASTLEDMTAVLQRMAVMQAVPSAAQSADPADPEAAEIVGLAGLLPPDETQLLYSLCLHGRTELGLAPDEYAALTMVLLRLLAFKPGALNPPAASAEKKSPPEPLNRPAPGPQAARPDPITARGTAPVAPAPARPPAAAPVPPATPVPPSRAPMVAAVPAVDAPAGQVLPVVEPRLRAESDRAPVAIDGRPGSPVLGVPVRVQTESPREAASVRPATGFVHTEEGDFWHATVQALVAAEAVNALVRELALQSQLVGRDTDHWLLRVERESLNQPTTRERLQAALHAAGHRVTLAVEVGPVNDSPARRNAHAASERQREAEALILADPFVQKMIQDFGAKIVPGSIKPVQANGSHS
jgi:DNA polymerase-3 subunit gamma/tau